MTAFWLGPQRFINIRINKGNTFLFPLPRINVPEEGITSVLLIEILRLQFLRSLLKANISSLRD